MTHGAQVWLLGALVVLGSCAAVVYGMGARAQKISMEQPLGNGATAPHGEHVHLASDLITVRGGQQDSTELRFHVDDGFHINSHKPLDEFLIPTRVTFDDRDAVKVLEAEYPKGESFQLAAGAGETLSVYKGELRVALRMRAPKGNSTLSGTLRYQACDARACFPPRTLPFSVAVHGE